jgi:hypothetical protein
MDGRNLIGAVESGQLAREDELPLLSGPHHIKTGLACFAGRI